ncbi:MAG: hypothetical protein WDA70_01060 [Lysobacteraceae bacterium]
MSSSQHGHDVISKFGKKIRLNHTLAKSSSHFVLVVATGQFTREMESQINAELGLVKISQIVNERQRAAGMDEADMR